MTTGPWPAWGKANSSTARFGWDPFRDPIHKGDFMSLLIGAFTIGLVLSLLALGVFISFRIFHIADITAEGSLTLGAAATATLLASGVNPVAATAAGFLGGMMAGTVTGILHTKFKIHSLLSGILVM